MSLQAYGVERFAALIEQNIAQADYLAECIERQPRLELLAPVELNVVCFRYVTAPCDEAALNALNQEILLRIQERGIAVPSSTMLDGRYALRSANVNHRTRHEDIDALVDAVVAIGDEVLAGG